MISTLSCRICGHAEKNKMYAVKEMMFGSQELFDYFQCGHCGCLQITDIPTDLARHYPQHYFSFKRLKHTSQNSIRRFFDQRRVKNAIVKPDMLGKLANLISKPLNYLTWIKAAKLNLNAQILDIGCGKGQLLLRMHLGGFKYCTGLDPFLQETIVYDNGITIYKASLEIFLSTNQQPFDLIMLHHSLEHMENPQQTLALVAKLLSKNGTILIRIPVADSYAWKHYDVNWAQIDAPRHLYLLTQKSLSILADNVNLKIDNVTYDSTPFQFIGSELYKRNIPMTQYKNKTTFFTHKELKAFNEKTKELNDTQQGDQSVFYLSHTNN
jgi:2-polyprenyl-3-methyl-5-hydroxy-6-metoxy-1,4-benzoquinol methylase